MKHAFLLLVTSGLISPAPAAELELTLPREQQVIQRTSFDQGMIPIAGCCNVLTAGEVALEARLFVNGQPTAWRTLDATVSDNAFQATLSGPAGGWHRLEVRALKEDRVLELASVERVGIGEVFVVAGQSNAANHGEEKQTPQSDRVVTFDGEQWQHALDPQPGASGKGGSFLPPLGDSIEREFDVPVGFVACGIGATSVREWLPRGITFPNPPTVERRVTKQADGSWSSDGEAFDAFVSRLKSLRSHGFRAVLWHQGESDANQKDSSRTLSGKLYRTYLETVIQTSRREIGWNAPWFVAQVSYHNPSDPSSPEIRAAQASLWTDRVALPGPDSDALTGDLRARGGQGVHFSGKGLRVHAACWADIISDWIKSQQQ